MSIKFKRGKHVIIVVFKLERKEPTRGEKSIEQKGLNHITWCSILINMYLYKL